MIKKEETNLISTQFGKLEIYRVFQHTSKYNRRGLLDQAVNQVGREERRKKEEESGKKKDDEWVRRFE